MFGDFLDELGNLEFRPLDEQFIRDFWPMIVEIIGNPSSNPPAAIALLLIAIVLMILIGLAVLSVVASFGRGDDEELEYVAVSEGTPDDEIRTVRADTRVTHDPLRYHRAALWIGGSLLAVLVMGGASSQTTAVCLSCHGDVPHTAQREDDSHASVRCVSCHESGGALSSVTVAVPARIAHVVTGLFEASPTVGFGPVAGRACLRCHSSVADEVVEIADRSLLVSHSEPLEAGAGCLDCHKLDENAKIGQATKGMGTCLRCHNEVDASAACETCHLGDVSDAVLVSFRPAPRRIITQPNCYTCHDPAPCDSCHQGVRLPHPPDYAWTHMYDAARDIWFNAGRACYSCHTDERNSCYQAGCHDVELAYHYRRDPSFPRTHGDPATYPRVDDPYNQDPDCGGCHRFAATFDSPCEMCHRQ